MQLDSSFAVDEKPLLPLLSIRSISLSLPSLFLSISEGSGVSLSLSLSLSLSVSFSFPPLLCPPLLFVFLLALPLCVL